MMKNNVLDNVALSTLRLFLILRTRRTTTTKTTISDNSQLQPWRSKKQFELRTSQKRKMPQSFVNQQCVRKKLKLRTDTEDVKRAQTDKELKTEPLIVEPQNRQGRCQARAKTPNVVNTISRAMPPGLGRQRNP